MEVSLSGLRELTDKAVYAASAGPQQVDSEDAAAMSAFWSAVTPRTVKALLAAIPDDPMVDNSDDEYSPVCYSCGPRRDWSKWFAEHTDSCAWAALKAIRP